MTSQETINNTLWKACDTFRGKIDSSIYKDYILVMLFVKYLSDTYKERYEDYKAKYEGDAERIKRALSRERFVLNERSTFDYIYSKRNDNEIGDIINKALENIEEENKTKLRGVFRNIDFNSEIVLGKTRDKNSVLKHLLEDFSTLDLRPSRLNGNDVIGDSYEYMISMFASDAGKKGGEFFTPSMVSELISRLVKPEENDRIYDPTCGSGSLLIRAFKKVPNGKAQIYGQERNGQTHSLCRMNMFLHGIDDAKIAWGDTLANPLHLEGDRLMKFQVCVANPPFSLDKWAMGFAGKGANDRDFKMEASLDKYRRFEWGVPPTSKGDYAFVLHMLYSLAENGRMGVVLPNGVLFRGAGEGKIRKQIIDFNLLDAVIGLPNNLFFGTGIPACILVFKKGRNRKEVLFIDGSGDGNYEKGKNQNKLREEDLGKIIEAYDRYETIEKYSHLATIDEIKDNDYNLNIPRYVDTYEEEELIDVVEVTEKVACIKSELAEVEAQMAKHLEELGFTSKTKITSFNGEWQEVRLGEILRERKEIGCSQLELLAITSKNGVVKRDGLSIKNNSSEDKSKYKKICPYDIGYNTMRMWQGVSGVSKYEGIVSPAYTILSPTAKVYPHFIGFLFKLPKVINIFWKHSQGLVNDTLNLKYDNLKKIKLKMPTDIYEQKAISNILLTVDKEIECVEQELELLNKKKKVLMQLLLTGKVRVPLEKR